MSKGVDSIRLRGQRIEELPLGLGNEAKEQLPGVIKAERLNNIATVVAKYPSQRIDYITSRINECRENITRIHKLRGDQEKMISEYSGHIAMCKHRDKEIDKLENATDGRLMQLSMDEIAAEIKALRKQFPPYNVAAMEQQIVQCREAIERTEVVITRENDSITEFSEVHALCKVRDLELKALGASAEG